MLNQNRRNIVSMILFAMLALMGCTGNGGTQHEQQPTDTTYTQRAAMMVRSQGDRHGVRSTWVYTVSEIIE